MDKLVVIINGSGGVGKDTVCEAAAAFWKTRNISSITPILQVARAAGWDGVKTPASRRFLSELKQSCSEFNDLPFRYCAEQLIREPEEIARFRESAGEECRTLLVTRPAMEQARGALGNRSDDGVAGYQYDRVFVNDGALDALPDKVHAFFADWLKNTQ